MTVSWKRPHPQYSHAISFITIRPLRRICFRVGENQWQKMYPDISLLSDIPNCAFLTTGPLGPNKIRRYTPGQSVGNVEVVKV
jgi:hypothetical protein